MNAGIFEALTFLSLGLELIPQYPSIITKVLALITGVLMLLGGM